MEDSNEFTTIFNPSFFENILSGLIAQIARSDLMAFKLMLLEVSEIKKSIIDIISTLKSSKFHPFKR